MLPTSLTAANELSRAKSISETSTSTHRTAALNSSDIVAHVGINEAMLTPVAEWRTRRCRDACHGSRQRTKLELVDQVPARLASHEHPAARTGLADLGTDGCRAQPLVLRQIREARPMAFARVDHPHACGTRRGQHLL